MKNSIIILLAAASLSIILTSCSSYTSRYSFKFGEDGLIYNSSDGKLFTGTVKDTADVVIEFQVVNGRKNGFFKTTYLNGKIEKFGYVINNDNVGEWKYYYPAGEIESQGSFQNNVPEGKWISYYRNGNKKCEGIYRKGKQEDVWIYYNENGDVINRIVFGDGEFIDLLDKYS